LRLLFEELKDLFRHKLIKYGFADKNSITLAEIFADNTFSGVESHGINRFPGFIKCVVNGSVNVNAVPSLINSFAAVERWDADFGAGPLNALKMTKRGIELAKKFGIGCIVLKNSNHWMRPGYFGWYAADRGFILICWTNTIPNVPPWGAVEPKTGNNPIVIAIPRKKGNIVLDMALSQFSYGKMLNFKKEGKDLPFPGGFDSDGNLTLKPGDILKTERAMPAGYWKGSNLSLVLDIMASVLSGGKSTKDLSESPDEKGPSQIFILINPATFSSRIENEKIINEILSFFKSAKQIDEQTNIYYPGEGVLMNKKKKMKEGIDIDNKLYEEIKRL
jgi:3-dehydro-L-gulonate 2-dehydrogenase